jgi:hypothetical protein
MIHPPVVFPDVSVCVCVRVCVCVCVAAIEIQTIGPVSMKFGTLEDHDPVMVFMYV